MSNSRAASAMGGSRSAGASTSAAARKTYFEQQRELLMGEIAMSFEQVLANINKLNRSLEAVVTVGNEFSAVEALWSQFEGVMGKEPEPEATAGGEGEGDDQEHEEGQEHDQQGHEGEEEHDQHDEEDEEAATQLHDDDAVIGRSGTNTRRRYGL